MVEVVCFCPNLSLLLSFRQNLKNEFLKSGKTVGSDISFLVCVQVYVQVLPVLSPETIVVTDDPAVRDLDLLVIDCSEK